MLELEGVTIAARNLMPKMYEARGFKPTWKSTGRSRRCSRRSTGATSRASTRAIITSTRCAPRARRSPPSTR